MDGVECGWKVEHSNKACSLAFPFSATPLVLFAALRRHIVAPTSLQTPATCNYSFGLFLSAHYT